ncbi:MAG TPA: hypothetical protein VEZ90_19440 [Blastocatellia bacterium]|nr:hypothetical protein [Blastocatellia bacterium]
MYRAALALILTLGTFAAGQSALKLSTQTSRPAVANALRSALQRIKNKTNVPILLPGELPASMHPNKIRFADGAITADGWSISLLYKRGYGEAGSAGGFDAESGQTPNPDDFDKVVTLTKGIKGYYSARSCGGSCTPPEIDWVYKGVLYSVQLTVNNKSASQDEAEMIATANSAIRGGPR